MTRLLVAGCWLLGVLSAPATTERARLALRLAVLLILAPLAFAAITTSALTGRVTISDTPGVRVTVTATSPALQHPRTTITGPRGTYWLGALPPGAYEVTFSLSGHTSLTRTAVVELARVARVDATLEPSEDEESVTSTATTIAVSETTSITTHFDDATLDRLPLGRTENATLIPDPFVHTLAEVDGLYAFLGGYLPEDLLEQATAVRGAIPVAYQSFGGNVLALRTRRGREDLFASLRDTVGNDSGARHLLEATAGGPIVRDRLWFFGAGWSGETVPVRTEGYHVRGFNAKLHVQAGDANHFDASFTKSHLDAEYYWDPERLNNGWLQHTGLAGPHFTWETHAARASYDAEFLTSRASYAAPTRSGDHVLTAGLTQWRNLYDFRAFFVSDRWSSARWVVDAGVRHEEDRGFEQLLPRLAVTYDLLGDGRRSLAGSYGEYVTAGLRLPKARITALGYGTAIGRSGAMRVDILRRDTDADLSHSLQLDGRYRMFDRFEAGATYSYDNVFSHKGNLWLSAELPIGEHELGVTVLQRYRSSDDPPRAVTLTPTDLALRYAIPFPRIRLTLAADATDVFQQEHELPRTLRFWVRLLFR